MREQDEEEDKVRWRVDAEVRLRQDELAAQAGAAAAAHSSEAAALRVLPPTAKIYIPDVFGCHATTSKPLTLWERGRGYAIHQCTLSIPSCARDANCAYMVHQLPRLLCSKRCPLRPPTPIINYAHEACFVGHTREPSCSCCL